MPIDLVIDSGVEADAIPKQAVFAGWVGRIADSLGDDRLLRDICIRICTARESRRLSKKYRSLDKPTNVLSFPAEFDFSFDEAPLGDLAICWDVVSKEAVEQAKPIDAHLAHLTIHGVLHLLGLNHQEPAEATAMEQLEIEVLAAIGIANPYQ